MSAHETFYTDLIAHLKASSGIGDAVGDRVHLERFPAGTIKPVLTVETVDSDVPEYLGRDTPDKAMIQVAFNCWAERSLDTLKARDAVYTEFKDFAGLLNSNTDVHATVFRGDSPSEQEPSSSLLRRRLSFEFWY